MQLPQNCPVAATFNNIEAIFQFVLEISKNIQLY